MIGSLMLAIATYVAIRVIDVGNSGMWQWHVARQGTVHAHVH